ncbi:MAG: FecR domain-containing protein [Rudaea sp.]|uniref:FecR family protein n=1 Tax=Rudaea sp. TaxID=2136325 RepID=UPI0039E57696
MKPTSTEVINELTLAEASAWLTRLQEFERTAATEAAFKEWLGTSPAHARAFTRVNDVWELIAGAAAEPAHRPHSVHRDRRGTRRRKAWIAASACAALLLAAVGIGIVCLLPEDRAYQTVVGAQQTVVLDDTTRVTLNTDTRLVVAYRKNERRILLERGEALFEVAKNPQRPFVVQTGGEQVVALGTTFDVRRDPTLLAVTLFEGKVQVAAQTASSDHLEPLAVLAPGERLTIRPDGAHALDRPKIEAALAWQRGQAYFDDATLADAVAELNRYGGTRIRFADSSLATLRVSGVFSTRDPGQFASAVASLHQLRAVRDGASIVLTR